jgi:hypothetical protein
LTKTISLFCHQEAQEAQFSKPIFSLKMNLNLVHIAPLRGYTIFEFSLNENRRFDGCGISIQRRRWMGGGNRDIGLFQGGPAADRDQCMQKCCDDLGFFLTADPGVVAAMEIFHPPIQGVKRG